MEYPSLFPETVLQLYRAFFYCMAFIFAGGALIGLSIYLVLVGSEMFFSEPRSKSQPAKAPQSARRAPVAEETLELSYTEAPILAPRDNPNFSDDLIIPSDLRFGKEGPLVDPSSVRFHGATPLGTVIQDVDGDGKPDLLLTFDMADVKLDAKATAARLTGWFNSSQNFVGEDKIRVAPSLAGEDPSCR